MLLDGQDRGVQFRPHTQQGILDLLDDVGLDALGRFIELSLEKISNTMFRAVLLPVKPL
jgi:hypothetical protein